MRNQFLFTSESVSEGHPDKVADQISDAIVDLFLSKDPEARIACETLTTTQLVVLAGEIRCKGVYENGAWAPGAQEEIEATVRATVKRIGYEQDGFHWQTFRFENNLHGQSAHIAQGVDESGNKDEGAGDQGIMFGFATTETEAYMPMPLWLAHRLAQQLSVARKTGAIPYLRPDGKTQVTIGFEDGKPVELNTVVISTQHDPGVGHDQIEADLKTHVIEPVLAMVNLDSSRTRYLINPSGDFVTGGPDGDAGLTGRKIIVDTYGGASRHGGGAFSGKDPTKVDRSAAYALRWVAKNVVAAGLADKVEIQVSYAIGTAHPVSIFVETFGTEKVDTSTIEKAIATVFDLRPKAIIEELDLLNTPFLPTAAYGHFGRTDVDFPWERLNRVEQLRQASGL